MVRLLLGALLLLPGAALAQQSFSGSYVYQTPQGAVTLVLQQQGNTVTGSMRGADGSMFQLQGALQGEGAMGNIGNEGGVGFFAIGFVDSQLKLVVAEIDPATGQPDLDNGWNIDFTPAGAPMAGGGRPGMPQGGSQPGMPQPGMQPGAQQPGMQPGAQGNVERDPAIVGHWRYSDTYSSGDFSATTTLQMQVNPDGSYLYGSGNVSLGGGYSGNSGGGGNVTAGQWRTQGGVVYVMEQGSPQWTPYARYYVEGSSMMFTFGDGSRQLWQRQ